MKKIIVILSAALLLLAGTNAFAQMSSGLGYVNSTTVLKLNKNGDGSTSNVNGLYAGFGYTIPLVEGLNVTPGVYYELLYEQDADELWGMTASGTRIEHYINVPVTFSYGLSPMSGVRVFVFAGPTASYGLASTTRGGMSIGNISLGGKTDNYEDGDYGRFDLMIGGGAGVQLGGFRLTAGYDLGLLNRYTGTVDGISRQTRRFYIGIGRLF